ncbi:MAG TPA: hypothetical protein VKT51_03495 [Candidatus Eremiobacteraceae bacterium]|nr:hypothetical protein [Candidatus Eremiobacteraceae bacterium]
MLRRVAHVLLVFAFAGTAIAASNSPSAAATQVIMGKVTTMSGDSFQMRSDAGNMLTVRRANAIVFDLADRPLSWNNIRGGDTITVYGAVVAAGTVNAINVRIRSGPIPPGRRVVMGVVVSVSRDALQMRSKAGYMNTVYRKRANVFNLSGAASSWEALRAGLPITVYGDIVSDGVLNAINIRIR